MSTALLFTLHSSLFTLHPSPTHSTSSAIAIGAHVSLLARSRQPGPSPWRGGPYDRQHKTSTHQQQRQRPASNSVFGATKSNRLSALAPPRPAGRGGWGEWGPEVRQFGSQEVRIAPRPRVNHHCWL